MEYQETNKNSTAEDFRKALESKPRQEDWLAEIEAMNSLIHSAKFLQRLSRHVDEQLKPLKWLFHVSLLLEPEKHSSKETLSSAKWLATRIWGKGLSAYNAKTRAGIKRLREQFVRTEDFLSVCVLQAVADTHLPQKIRLGRKWITTKNGKVYEEIPGHLESLAYGKWLVKRSREYLEIRAIEEWNEGRSDLLESLDKKRGARRKKRGRSSSGQNLTKNYVEEDLIQLLSKKEDEVILNSFDRIKPLLSCQQQKYLEYKILAFEGDSELTERGARLKACKAMGMTAANARKIELRIRKKFKNK
jgi:hypothetical protein